MADLCKAFDEKEHEFSKVKYDNSIDYFFTQRKVVEYKEYIDAQMNRQKKKVNSLFNFVSLNLPHNKLKQGEKIFIEIWGDKGFNYKGEILNHQGVLPHLMIRLLGDTQIFVKLYLSENDDTEHFINFIQIPKRYQSLPVSEKEE